MIKSERRAAGGWQFPPIRVQRSEITSSGRKLHPGISLRVGPFHLFQPSPFDTSAAHYATRHPRLVRSRFRAQKYVHRQVKSALANLFVILSPISFFLLRFSPFFFFFFFGVINRLYSLFVRYRWNWKSGKGDFWWKKGEKKYRGKFNTPPVRLKTFFFSFFCDRAIIGLKVHSISIFRGVNTWIPSKKELDRHLWQPAPYT